MMAQTSRLPLSAAAARQAGMGPLRHVEVTGSTNDDLADEARRGQTHPAVLVADHQTAGRGRLSRRWVDVGATTLADASQAEKSLGGASVGGASVGGASVGGASLLVSLRFPAVASSEAHDAANAMSSEAGSSTVVSVAAMSIANAVSAAALSAASAAAARKSEVRVRSKWPNDLLLEWPGGSGKLAGLLAEIIDGDMPSVVVGLGMNIAAAPPEPAAVSLADAGIRTTRDEVLAALLETLPDYLTDPASARDELLAASATIGSRVRVISADGSSIVGTARSVDASGRLIVTVHGRDHVVDAGDVFHLRPA